MNKLSAIIPTGDEEQNIFAAIKSVEFADEIIIVDSYSKDKTVEIASKLADTILQREYVNSASQKNWAIPQAKFKWILLIDADERVTPELEKEIKIILNSENNFSGYWIKRENYFMGKKVRFSGWRGDKVIRLFKRDECKYEEKNVHSEIITNGKIGILKNALTHNTFISKEIYLEKLTRYAKWQAKDYHKRTKSINSYHTKIKPFFRFLKHYVLQLGILDGLVGYTISMYQAEAVRMRYKYLKEYRNGARN